MSIYEVQPDGFETFSVLTRPERTYISSSNASIGISGSIPIYGRRSKIIKDPTPDPIFVSLTHDDTNIGQMLLDLQAVAQEVYVGGSDPNIVTDSIRSYMSKVHGKTQSPRNAAEVTIQRWTQGGGQDSELYKKLHIKDVLIPTYKGVYPSAEWGYVGYHCLNFYNNNTMLSTPVTLLYPQVGDWQRTPASSGLVSGSYVLDGEFSFDFHINVRHNQARRIDYNGDDISTLEWNAGTIMHLSGCYALSIHSGSARGIDGNPTGFRLSLGLMTGSSTPPSSMTVGTNVDSGNDLVFFSDDNALQYNHWHRVVVRWGTSERNNGTGSFNVDGVDRGTFVMNRATTAPILPDIGAGESRDNVLFIGNFFEGENLESDPLGLFFTDRVSQREGVVSLRAGTADDLASYDLRHRLQAELHDVILRRQYMTDTMIAETSGSITSASLDSNIAFYVGPHYLPYTPHRSVVAGAGGIGFTPFTYMNGSTVDPYNVGLFGTSGLLSVNLENFCSDVATGNLPRFRGAVVPVDAYGAEYWKTAGTTTPDYLALKQAELSSRNHLVIPCDDGTFLPDYSILSDPSGSLRYTDDSGRENKGLINLQNVYSTGSQVVQVSPGYSDLCSSASLTLQVGPSQYSAYDPIGPTPSWYLNQYSADNNLLQGSQFDVPTALYNRTLDTSSAAVVGWNISNLFYGKRISPGSLTLTDTSWIDYNTGILGKLTLRDDGSGGIYRADCETTPASWASVGTVFYDEGIILIKSPNLYRFGETSWTLNFKGEYGVHVLKIDAIAPANELNVSRNPTYKTLKPSNYPNDPDSSFVYITGVNFHDENLNIIMKAQLAQPLIKRLGDRIVIRPRLDF